MIFYFRIQYLSFSSFHFRIFKLWLLTFILITWLNVKFALGLKIIISGTFFLFASFESPLAEFFQSYINIFFAGIDPLTSPKYSCCASAQSTWLDVAATCYINYSFSVTFLPLTCDLCLLSPLAAQLQLFSYFSIQLS